MKRPVLLELLLATGLGTAGAFGFPPWDIFPLTLLAVAALAVLVTNVSPSRAALLTWVMFTAQNFVGLNWISEAFLVVIPNMGLGALGPVLCLAAGLSLIPTLLVYIWQRFWPQVRTGKTASMLALAICISGSEWLTGHLFTGLPWAITSLAASEIGIAQSASTFGAYGIGLLLLAPSLTVTGAIWRLVHEKNLPVPDICLVIFTITLLTASWAAHPNPGPKPVAKNDWPVVRLVQGNTAQREKWKPENQNKIFSHHIELSKAPARKPLAAVIWSETATPFQVIEAPAAVSAIGRLAALHNGYVLLGTPTRTDINSGHRQYNNSLIAINAGGKILARYDKAHLVPGGEYIPFQDFLPFGKLVETRGYFKSGPGIRTIRLDGLPPFSPLICYEVIFPGEVALNEDRPDWIVNITNDAWYGDSAGPYQHLAISRLRAIEEGLPLVRVANTGISAAFDGKGRELGRIELGTSDFLDIALPPPETQTLYARHGDKIYLILLIIFSAVSLLPCTFRSS
jgi:apolipoprotein N-acyltransferase